MLGGGANPAAYHEVDGKRLAHDGSGEAAAQSSVAAGNDTIGLRLESGIEPVADVWWAPIETISNSEGGFERIYQGSGQLISWLIALQPGERLDARISQVDPDHPGPQRSRRPLPPTRPSLGDFGPRLRPARGRGPPWSDRPSIRRR